MPLATSLVWKLDGEHGDARDGKIDIHLNSIFLNGKKRGRVIDLNGLPTHDGETVHLRFACGGEVRATLVGGRLACSAFVEDCVDILKRKGGKIKLDAPMPVQQSPVQVSSCMDSNTSASPVGTGIGSSSTTEPGSGDAEESIERASPALPELSPEEKLISKALGESIQEVLLLVSETSPARDFLNTLCNCLDKSSPARAIVKACEALEKLSAEQNEKHRNEKMALRLEVSEAQQRCERLLKGRDALEKEMNSLGKRLNVMKGDYAKLEQSLLRERSATQPNPSAKRARTSKSSGVPKVSEAPSGTSTHEELVRSIAALEVEPLKQCNAQAREALKKKILLKWHPDKQPSEDHKSLATSVMQELQNCTDWMC